MFGPVCQLELLRVARRGRHHFFRTLLVVYLAGQVVVFGIAIWARIRLDGSPGDRTVASQLLEAGLYLLILEQWAVIVLTTPALAAGSITDEKTTGTLQHLLACPLDSWDIVCGKWLAQMAQVLGLTLPFAPLIVLLGEIAGLPAVDLLAVLLHGLAPVPALAAVAILCSVWCRQTNQAVLFTYLVLALAGCSFS